MLGAPLPAAACPNGDHAGADGEEKAEIMRIGPKNARNCQSYDCPDSRSIVHWVSDEAKTGAGDNSGEKQEQGVGTRLLSVLDGTGRNSEKRHEGQAARRRKRFNEGCRSDSQDPEYCARQWAATSDCPKTADQYRSSR